MTVTDSAAVQDVEMEVDASNETENKKDQDVVAIIELREQIKQIEKDVAMRFILHVLRSLPSTRSEVNAFSLHNLALTVYPSVERDAAMALMPAAVRNAVEPEVPKQDRLLKHPLYLLLLVKLNDDADLKRVSLCGEVLMTKIFGQNRRTLALISARSYFYYSRVAELNQGLEGIRSFLHARLRTATLRNDFEGQAVLINCLLRNYLHYSLYDQADKLVKKSVYPESASNNEWARFLYYLRRIKAAKLE